MQSMRNSSLVELRNICKVGGENMWEFTPIRVPLEIVALFGVLTRGGGGVGVRSFFYHLVSFHRSLMSQHM